jgi:hypothetical protein
VGGTSLLLSSGRNLRDKVLKHTAYHGLPRMLRGVYDAAAGLGAPPVTPSEIEATATLVDQLIAGSTTGSTNGAAS